MTQVENITQSRKGKHLNLSERKMIEAWKTIEKPLSNRAIATLLGRAPQTIHTEVKEGTIRQIKRQTHNGIIYDYATFVYSADAGQANYEKARHNSRKPAKWTQSPAFMDYADDQMRTHKQSPDVVVGKARQRNLFPDESIPCTTTLYSYIEQGLMRTSNIDLLLKLKRKNTVKRHRQNQRIQGDSIDIRPNVITNRKRFGDWEIDTVIGKREGKEAVLLTLTERQTRYELIFKIASKTSDAVGTALQTLQDSVGMPFSCLFKSITSDNGSEFAKLNNQLPDTTHVYYTHPYSSWERGTNEHHNGIIRRFIPKGKSMKNLTERTVKRVQDWMNRLPRKHLDYATPEEQFLQAITEQLLKQTA